MSDDSWIASDIVKYGAMQGKYEHHPVDDMEPLPADKKELSDLLENTTDNYAKAKECNAKANAWKEWYDTQKKIFEEVK